MHGTHSLQLCGGTPAPACGALALQPGAHPASQAESLEAVVLQKLTCRLGPHFNCSV
jgi:hypothetical protein